jgi:Protein of unknown function (DUF1360)
MAQSPDSVQHLNGEPATGGPAAGYAPDAVRPPLTAYATIAGAFASGLATFLVVRRQRLDGLPERIAAQDIALVSSASFALSRLLAKKKVTAFIRAPFTEFQGHGDAPGELEERPRGSGPRRAIGELLVCPYCLDMWAATAGVLGLVAAPRETRVVASILSAFGLSDFLQGVYRHNVAD